MRLPVRRSQTLKRRDDETATVHLTSTGLERLKRDLEDMQTRQRPQAVEDVSHAVQKGDLSENAEYQEARARLSRIDTRVFSIKERLKRVVVIEHNDDGRVHLGSRVTVDVNGKEKVYDIVGPHESNPSRGRISHVSPLGSALLNHGVGEAVTLTTENGEALYRILSVE